MIRFAKSLLPRDISAGVKSCLSRVLCLLYAKSYRSNLEFIKVCSVRAFLECELSYAGVWSVGVENSLHSLQVV